MSRRDLWITFLVILGFVFTYIEGAVIEHLNKLYIPDAWYPNQAICWIIAFGIFHSMLLVHRFAGGRFRGKTK